MLRPGVLTDGDGIVELIAGNRVGPKGATYDQVARDDVGSRRPA
ncbi:hypothetical protein [Amycolatopsis sp. lyj-84]